MAKQSEEKDEIVKKEVKKVKKPIPKKEEYVLKVRKNIGGQWKEKGEKIKLTKKAYKDFRSKNIV